MMRVGESWTKGFKKIKGQTPVLSAKGTSILAHPGFGVSSRGRHKKQHVAKNKHGAPPRERQAGAYPEGIAE